jgi:serine/threonine-protein kinase
MAHVFLAVGRGPSGFNKLVVLKVMKKHLAVDNDMRRMFLAEARLSARLNHANIVQVYEVADGGASPCIVMEYLEGQSMASVLRAGGERFTLPMQLRTIAETLAGLHYSHELRDYDGTPLQIVHRDVSPQNVFVTYDGVVKLLDFGIAKVTSAPTETQTGIVKGKISYMAREQLLGEPLDRRADIFSVGCMLWAAAAGATMWEGQPEGTIMRCLIQGDIPKPSTKRPVDPTLEAIVMKAVAADPVDRYPTALDLQQDIDQYLAGLSTPPTTRTVGVLVSELFANERSGRDTTVSSALSRPHSEPPEPDVRAITGSGNVTTGSGALSVEQQDRQQSKWRTLLPIALVLLLVGAASAAFLRTQNQPPPAVAAPAAATSISVRVQATPSDSEILFNGQRLASNPAVMRIPLDSSEHVIRATAPGHVSEERRLRFERDTTVELTLEKLKDPLKPAVSATAEPTAEPVRPRYTGPAQPRPGKTEPTPAKSNCDPPFYFINGVKAFKPECL